MALVAKDLRHVARAAPGGSTRLGVVMGQRPCGSFDGTKCIKDGFFYQTELRQYQSVALVA